MLCRFGNSSGTIGPCRQSKTCAVAPVLQGRSCFRQQRQVAVIALAGAVTEGAEQQESEQEEQQQQQQRQQQQSQQRDRREEKYTATRARRLSRAVGDSSTPNTGVVVITERSNVPGAAACVAADFKTNRVTRIVPFSPDLTQKAFDVHRLAASMLNNNLQQEAAAGEQELVKQALVFQPVEIMGDLVAPPALPLGAVALYTSCIRAGHTALQEILSKRAAALAAAEEAGADYVAQGPGEGSQRVFVSKKSDFIRVAGALNQALSREGWAELVCVGRLDQALPVALQALVKIRRIRYGKHQDDASMVLLGDEGILGVNARSNAPSREGVRPPTSFLLMRCAKNYPTKLLKMQQSAGSTDS